MKKAKKAYLIATIICIAACALFFFLAIKVATPFAIGSIATIAGTIFCAKKYDEIKNYEDYSKYTRSTPITNIKVIMGKKYDITPLSEE